jgi:hypothetical protein
MGVEGAGTLAGRCAENRLGGTGEAAT